MPKAQLVYDGKLIKLAKESKRLPNGYIAELEIIKHPGAVLIVPFLNKDKVILLWQFRPVVKSYLYELPAGTLGKKEQPLHCARRELIEETGYSAAKLSLLGKIYPVPGYSTEKIIIYKAEGLKKTKRLIQEDEVIENRIFNKGEIRQLFKKGLIVDAKTISGFAMCGYL